MSSRLLIFGLIVFCQPISAGQVNQYNVNHIAGVYTVSFDVEIDKDIDTVREVVTDDANLAQLSDMLVESQVFSSPKDKSKHRLLVARVCFLFVCRKVKLVERIDALNRDAFITTVIPEQCDFKSGTLHWQLTKLADHRTRLEFHGEEEPDFWIPPVIGPYLVKHLLLKETMVIIANIENYSADG